MTTFYLQTTKTMKSFWIGDTYPIMCREWAKTLFHPDEEPAPLELYMEVQPEWFQGAYRCRVYEDFEEALEDAPEDGEPLDSAWNPMNVEGYFIEDSHKELQDLLRKIGIDPHEYFYVKRVG